MNARAFLVQKFLELDSVGTWYALHHKIERDSNKDRRRNGFTIGAANTENNECKNRYCDIFPWEHTRVRLGTAGSYINASHVAVPKANRQYILAQGPLDNTTGDFWQMVYEQDCRLIVMLNKFDADLYRWGCARYVPARVEQTEKFGDYKVTLLSEDVKQNFTIRVLRLERTDDCGQSSVNDNVRTLHHYQFTQWPDLDVPTTTDEFLEFLTDVRNSKLMNFDTRKTPTVVHCLAGIGRTGTFVTIDCVLSMLQHNSTITDTEVDIGNVVVNLRQQRMELIQTTEQLRFTWLAIVDALRNEKWAHLINPSTSNI